MPNAPINREVNEARNQVEKSEEALDVSVSVFRETGDIQQVITGAQSIESSQEIFNAKSILQRDISRRNLLESLKNQFGMHGPYAAEGVGFGSLFGGGIATALMIEGEQNSQKATSQAPNSLNIEPAPPV